MPYETSYIEITGALAGIICVILTTKENIWCWPTGIISVVLYGVFYYNLTFYASMYLQGIFFLFCIHGWYQWLYGGENKTKLKISYTKKIHVIIILAITLLVFIPMGFFFDKKSDDELPYLDSLLFSLSISAQWMMNQKLLENWLVWIVIDIIYAVMHFQRHHYPSFLMYGAFIVSATFGYYLWKKSLQGAQVQK
jgi:nicotinamide mononucleotide transporter